MSLSVKIASPCTANWDRMAGDDRVRHCPDCNLSVYNFSAMSPSDIDRLVAEGEGRLCGRFYQRSDGTMLTQNCPAGFRAVVSRASRAAAAALTTILSVSPAMARSLSRVQNSSLVQIQEQRQTGLMVTVLDPSEATVPNARVKVWIGTGQPAEGVTDSAGQLKLIDLLPGNYDVEVLVPGFVTSRTHVSVQAQGTELTVKLELQALMGEVVQIKDSHTNPFGRFFSGVRHIF